MSKNQVDRLENRRQDWDDKWSRGSSPLRFQTNTIPKEVRKAMEDAWFEPGAALVDIGCGTGEIAAWLALQNFKVLGVDFSQVAIDRAKSQYSDVEGSLEFEVVDLCKDIATSGRFSAVLDRGCFQGIPPDYHATYARNVASYCAAGARFLLLTNTRPNTERSYEERVRAVQTFLQPMFEISRFEEVAMIEAAPGVEAIPGVAFWLIRR